MNIFTHLAGAVASLADGVLNLWVEPFLQPKDFDFILSLVFQLWQ